MHIEFDLYPTRFVTRLAQWVRCLFGHHGLRWTFEVRKPETWPYWAYQTCTRCHRRVRPPEPTCVVDVIPREVRSNLHQGHWGIVTGWNEEGPVCLTELGDSRDLVGRDPDFVYDLHFPSEWKA